MLLLRPTFLSIWTLLVQEVSVAQADVLEYPVKRLARGNLERTYTGQTVSAQAINEQWLYAIESKSCLAISLCQLQPLHSN